MRWEPFVPDLSAGEIVLRVVLAAVLGGAVGAEREIREREAGLRTHLLVSVGSALFTLVSAYAWSDFAFSLESGVTLDPTRISAQIVTGIGFLGAGAIIRQGLSVRGLTTAATLWVVAAIGLASGAGYYWAAVVTTALVLVTLWPLRIVAHQLFLRFRPSEPRLFVELQASGGAAPVLETLEGLEVLVQAFRIDDDREGRRVALDVAVPAERRDDVVPNLARLDKVTAVHWSE
jgi:putative Mg2+ transporter-C (MgtC) family protein